MSVAALLVVAGVGIFVLSRDGGGDASGCLGRLAAHLPADAQTVNGSDLVRAREAGFEDSGSSEDLSQSAQATGVMSDPLTLRQIMTMQEPTGSAPYGPDAVDCWLGDMEQAFVARGRFDPGQVGQSEPAAGGSLQLNGSVLAHSPAGEPGDLLRTREQPTTLLGLVDALDRQDVISFSATANGDDPSGSWTAVGMTRTDRWELLVVWSLPDADAARSAEADVTTVLDENSRLGDLVEGEPAEHLRRDGSALWLRAPLSGEPASWQTPHRIFDPILTVLSDHGG